MYNKRANFLKRAMKRISGCSTHWQLDSELHEECWTTKLTKYFYPMNEKDIFKYFHKWIRPHDDLKSEFKEEKYEGGSSFTSLSCVVYLIFRFFPLRNGVFLVLIRQCCHKVNSKELTGSCHFVVQKKAFSGEQMFVCQGKMTNMFLG